MKVMHCPLNGPRNITEFQYGGPVRAEPPIEACDDQSWTGYLFDEGNPAGVVREWWMHIPSAYWFVAERDTRTDQIIRTYTVGELRSRIAGGEQP